MHSSSLIVATAGHVDHGKTSLVNHITGTNTDTLAEEKQRGLTINLGFAYHQFEQSINGSQCLCTLGFVDVPGHIDFISNMLAGVGSVDFALLVIAADDGIMPQTREHLAILDLLGIKNGAIALTKIDRVNEIRIAELTTEINSLIAESSLAASPVFPISNQSGEGIDALVDHLRQALVEKETDEHSNNNKNFRFLVDRAFSVKGIGTVVTGSARAGTATKNSELLCTSNGQAVRLRGLRLHENTIESVSTGQRAALNIDLDLNEVTRGDWLISPSIYRPITRFDANITLLDSKLKLRPSAEYHLYLGAAHHIVSLRYLNSENKKLIQVKVGEPVIAHHGDRFIIRDPAAEHTVGGGQVIDIFVPRKKRSSDYRLELLEAMCATDENALRKLTQLMAEGINLEQFSVNRNLTQSYLEELVLSLLQDASCVKLDIKINEEKVLLHKKFYDEYKNIILKEIGDFHSNNPSQQGISEPALSRSVNFSGSHLLFSALLQSLVDDDSVKRTGTLLHKPQHRSSLSKEEEEFLARIRPILEKAGNIPPRTRELVDLTGIPLKPLERILKQSTKAGSLIRVADNRHYLPETIMALAEFTERLANSETTSDGFSVIQFRDASGIGRNLCIEILEYFDRVGFTRRDGNARFLRTEKENIFGI